VRIPRLFNARSCFTALLLVSVCGVAGAQTPKQTTQLTSTLIPEAKKPAAGPVTNGTDLYCAGFIQYAPSPNQLKVVGGEQEQEQRVYSQGDYVYINAGSARGMRVGQEYTVVRPRGEFTTKLTKKKGYLGVYTEEVARLRVTDVREQVSVAQITESCETVLLGDLLRAAETRVAPTARRSDIPVARFANPTGKQQGHIVLARDGREMITHDEIVYIDLGAEDNVKPGDYLTVYRRPGTGNITRFRDAEVVPPAESGFESDRFHGGKFSSQSQGVEDPYYSGVYGPVENTPETKHHRPPVPRKVVGEMVVLNVQQRTATALITRVTQEIHTGDSVELQ